MPWQPPSPAIPLACLTCLLLNLKSRQVMPCQYTLPTTPTATPPIHILCQKPSQPAWRQNKEWENREARERGQIRAALSGNVLNISILFGLHVTGVLPGVSPWVPPLLPLSPFAGVYICHLGISFHLTLLALIFSVGIRIVASHFAPPRFGSPRLDVDATTHLRQVEAYLHK